MEARMSVLCVTSINSGDGKTAFCAGVTLLSKKLGKQIDAVKPLNISELTEPDNDATFLASISGTENQPGWPDLAKSHSNNAQLLSEVPKIIKRILSIKNDVIVELPSLSDGGKDRSSIPIELIEGLEGEVILIASYSRKLTSKLIIGSANRIGKKLAGVIVNQVPRYRYKETESALQHDLTSVGINVLGFIPEERSLQGVTVGQIAEHLGGEYLLGEDKKNQLFDNVLIGGIVLDNGVEYFNLNETKAVLVRADRPDIQMAALKTPTKCLVLTGGHKPVQYIEHEAREESVPVIMVKQGTLESSRELDTLFQSSTVHHNEKAETFASLIEKHFDIEALSPIIGWTS
ncbi:MAG: hypothetical protein DK304_000496 [Chloroflexi bacterium]|nr:MAG: hypothetical protein DK304_000496 [Chloroflexota bacterium]